MGHIGLGPHPKSKHALTQTLCYLTSIAFHIHVQSPRLTIPSVRMKYEIMHRVFQEDIAAIESPFAASMLKTMPSNSK
jgi:hypothetical protein